MPIRTSISASEAISGIVVPVSLFIALATGGGNPFRCYEGSCHYFPSYLVITFVLVAGALLTKHLSAFKGMLISILLICTGLLLYSIDSPFPQFVYQKAFGGGVSSALVLIFAGHLLRSKGANGLAIGIANGFAVFLCVTVIFKLQQGFFDRDIPYLFNGPIVFGWLMGVGGICSFYMAVQLPVTRWIGMTVAFTLAVLWSGSKGPILGFLLVLFLIFLSSARDPVRVIMRAALLGIVGYALIELLDFRSLLDSTRFDVVVEISDSGINYDEGSVGVRADAFMQALQIVVDNFPLGIGPGNFAIYNPLLMYPHNVHLEILLEYGAIPFMIYLVFVVFAMIRGDVLLRSIAIFIAICLSFSGDVSYMRFLLPFLLLCMIRYQRAMLRQPIIGANRSYV